MGKSKSKSDFKRYIKLLAAVEKLADPDQMPSSVQAFATQQDRMEISRYIKTALEAPLTKPKLKSEKKKPKEQKQKTDTSARVAAAIEKLLTFETAGPCRWSAVGLPACSSGVRGHSYWCRPCLVNLLPPEYSYEWGTAHADDLPQVVSSPTEEEARRTVKRYNSAPTSDGKGRLRRRVVGPWEPVRSDGPWVAN